jgi:hypothetical protein
MKGFRKHSRPKAWQSVLVLAALAPVFLDGCVSIGVSRSKTARAATGSLDMTVAEKSDPPNPPFSGSSPDRSRSDREAMFGSSDEP